MEKPPHIPVVGLLLELQPLHVGQVGGELLRKAFSQSFRGVEVLHVQDLLVLVLLGLGLQLLPGQLAFSQVDEEVAQGLEIVTPGLL